MRSQRTPGLPARLEGARQRFERWRKRRDRRRIPEALWAVAAQLGREYGVHRTARALRLNDQSLRQRVASAAVQDSHAPGAAGGFWELVPGGRAAAPVLGVPECIVEFEDAHGTKLRMHWKGGTVPDVSELRRAFWGAAR